MSAARLDQMVFGRRESAGLVVLASSFGDERLEWWEAELERHIRLRQYCGSSPPATALSYLRFDRGRAAVLRRRNESGAAARNASHALVGSAAVLSPEVAVGLGGWSWSEAPPVSARLEQVDGAAVTTTGLASHDRLRDEALSFIDDAEIVLACLLEESGAPLGIAGCPDQDRLALLWALHSAAAAYLAAHGVDRMWTFSTYEVEHDEAGPHTPEIIFLPSTYDVTDVVTAGTLIDLAEPPRTSPAATELARGLLDAALRGSAVAVDQLPPPPVRSITAVPTGGVVLPRDDRSRSTAPPGARAGRGGTADALRTSRRPERGSSSSWPPASRPDRSEGGDRPRTGLRRAMAGLVAAGVMTGIGFAAGSSAAPSPHGAVVSPGNVVVQGRLPDGVGIGQVGLYAVDGPWTLSALCSPAQLALWRCPLPADTSTQWVVGYAPPGEVPEVGASRASITILLWIDTGATG